MESQDFEAEQTKKRLRAREAESSPSLSDYSPGRGAGNSAIRRLIPGLRVQLKGKGGARLDETIARAIQAKRGGGQKLDEGTRERMESAMDQDFSGVRVHTDGQADRLSRSVRAEAFTTGSDIFFRSGKYEPESAEGRKLLGHELTHVVQQRNASPPSGMKVSSPEDASERQASDVGESLSGEGAALSREEEPSEVMRQGAPEEEEEEMAQTSPEVMRQDELPEEDI